MILSHFSAALKNTRQKLTFWWQEPWRFEVERGMNQVELRAAYPLQNVTNPEAVENVHAHLGTVKKALSFCHTFDIRPTGDAFKTIQNPVIVSHIDRPVGTPPEITAVIRPYYDWADDWLTFGTIMAAAFAVRVLAKHNITSVIEPTAPAYGCFPGPYTPPNPLDYRKTLGGFMRHIEPFKLHELSPEESARYCDPTHYRQQQPKMFGGVNATF